MKLTYRGNSYPLTLTEPNNDCVKDTGNFCGSYRGISTSIPTYKLPFYAVVPMRYRGRWYLSPRCKVELRKED
jgi:hypothetical protein